LMPSLETNHPNCEIAELGPPQSALACSQAKWGATRRTATQTKKDHSIP
jgi:hypothetical protein